MTPWVNRVPKFELDPDLPLQAVLVHTAGEIYRWTFLFTALVFAVLTICGLKKSQIKMENYYFQPK